MITCVGNLLVQYKQMEVRKDRTIIDMTGKKPEHTVIEVPPLKEGFGKFKSVYQNQTMDETDKNKLLEEIWKNSSSSERKRIEQMYPGSQEQYGSSRRRRKTKKRSKRSHKKTHKRRY